MKARPPVVPSDKFKCFGHAKMTSKVGVMVGLEDVQLRGDIWNIEQTISKDKSISKSELIIISSMTCQTIRTIRTVTKVLYDIKSKWIFPNLLTDVIQQGVIHWGPKDGIELKVLGFQDSCLLLLESNIPHLRVVLLSSR